LINFHDESTHKLGRILQKLAKHPYSCIFRLQ
jgi:hypothetical protein